MYPLFWISPVGSSAFIPVLCRLSLGAVTAGERNMQTITFQKQRLNAWFASQQLRSSFIILGSVGIAIYSNIKYGIALYVAHILAALTVGILFRFYGRNKHTAPPTRMTTPERSMGEIFDIALQNSIRNILTVCGAVLFFSVISRLFLNILPVGGVTSALVSGLLEFVTGTVKISGLTIPIMDKLVFTSVVVGFAGLSVHAQVMAVIARFHLSLAPYIIGKAMHGIIAGLYMYIYFRFNPITTAVFEPSMSRSFAISSTIETVTSIIVVIACIFCAFGLYLKQNSEYKRTLQILVSSNSDIYIFLEYNANSKSPI